MQGAGEAAAGGEVDGEAAEPVAAFVVFAGDAGEAGVAVGAGELGKLRALRIGRG